MYIRKVKPIANHTREQAKLPQLVPIDFRASFQYLLRISSHVKIISSREECPHPWLISPTACGPPCSISAKLLRSWSPPLNALRKS